MSWVELIPANVSSFSLCFVFFVCGLYVWFYFCVCAFGNGLVDACGGRNWKELMFSVFSFLCVYAYVLCLCVRFCMCGFVFVLLAMG